MVSAARTSGLFPEKKDDSMLTVATDVVDVDIGVSRGNLHSEATVTST